MKLFSFFYYTLNYLLSYSTLFFLRNCIIDKIKMNQKNCSITISCNLGHWNFEAKTTKTSENVGFGTGNFILRLNVLDWDKFSAN
jgi:hypothetical protein